MQDAVIVSTARTPIAKAFRGAFNDLKSPSMAAVALRAAAERAGIEPGEIEDVVMGTAMQGGTASTNLARLSLLAAPSMLDRAYDFEPAAFQPLTELLQRNAPVSVLDVPHQWSEWTRNVLAEADEVVVTAVPDLANLRNAKNLFDCLKKLRPNDKMPHLVLNQVGMPKRPEITPGDFCDSLEIEPVAIIPFDAVLFGNAANSGRMIAEIDKKAPVAETLSQLAHLVTGRAEVKKARKGGLGKMLGLLGRK